MTKTIGDGDKTDFDETRRLLYMALLVPRTKRYNLAGTLVNALVHHHAVDDLSWREAADHVIGYIEQEDARASGAWLEDQIQRVSAELGD
jgi:hypothetical protein